MTFVYAEHFLEHLEFPKEANHFMSEAFRVMKRGATLRIGVPDASLAMKYYECGYEPSFLHEIKTWHPAWIKTDMDHVQHSFRMWGEHKWAYDFFSLSRLMMRHRFVVSPQCQFQSGLDSEVRRIGTLYLEGTKP